jgi:alkylhydroperoxidase/carboxymuconolactone decarboxylase family protein YurZ
VRCASHRDRSPISQVAQHISVAGELPQAYGSPMKSTSRTWLTVLEHRTRHSRPQQARAALWAVVLLMGVSLLIQTAPPSRADGCGDVAGSVSVGGCSDPAPPPPAGPQWLTAIQQRDPQFADSYTAMRERILKDGAIPAKYKLLMGMITDAIAAHPDGVKTLADNARAAGASEAEITEAVEVGYLYGGTAALVMGANAFR